MHRLSRITLCIALAVMLLVSAVTDLRADDSVKTLTFGVLPTDSIARLKKWYEPFAEALDEKMGPNYRIETRYASDYAGIIEAMRFGKIDFSHYGNKSAIEAVDHAGAEVFAQYVSASGSPGYWSHIIVHKDSPYDTIDEVIEDGDKLVFGNGDPNSTSGFLVPGYYVWAQRGINPREHFKEVRNASHEANCLAVAKKQVDFATNNNMSIKRFKQNFPEMGKSIKKIWQSPLIPSDPMAWRRDLPKEDRTALKAALLAFGRSGPNAEREREILANLGEGKAPFLNSDNRQLIPIRQLELAKEKMRIEANEDLTPRNKAKRLEKIQIELRNLETYARLVKKY
jgi:phosphonate transport system substrate-binding protein